MELLMLRPSPQLAKAEIHFVGEETAGTLDRAAILQRLHLPVSFRERQQQPPVEKHVEKHVEEKATDEKVVQEEEEEEEEGQEEEDTQAFTRFLTKYASEPRKVVYQAPGSTWICPHVALLEDRADVMTACPLWWETLVQQQRAGCWEWIQGVWQSTDTKPSNYARLAVEDQQAVDSQVLLSLKKKYRLLTTTTTVPENFAPVVILDQVEIFCDRVLHKDPVATKLFRALRAARGTRVVGLTQFPCYRDPKALPLLFELVTTLTTALTKKQVSATKRTTRRQRQRTKKDHHNILEEDSEKMPMWANVPFQLERCEPTSKFKRLFANLTPGKTHLVYKGEDEELPAMFAAHGFSESGTGRRFQVVREDLVTDDADVEVFVLLSANTSNLWSRFKHIDVVHVLEPPPESLTQIFQVACCARHVESVSKRIGLLLYVEREVSSQIVSTLTKHTVPSSDGSPLYHYCSTYLGNESVVVSREEHLLETLLVQDYAIRKSIHIL